MTEIEEIEMKRISEIEFWLAISDLVYIGIDNTVLLNIVLYNKQIFRVELKHFLFWILFKNFNKVNIFYETFLDSVMYYVFYWLNYPLNMVKWVKKYISSNK